MKGMKYTERGDTGSAIFCVYRAQLQVVELLSRQLDVVIWESTIQPHEIYSCSLCLSTYFATNYAMLLRALDAVFLQKDFPPTL